MEEFTVAASSGGRRHQGQAPTCSFHAKASMANGLKARHFREFHFPSHLRRLLAAEDHRLRRLPEDTELSIFDAERYFKEGQDQTEHRRQGKGPVSDRAIPTTSSEASGRSQFNSLSNPLGPLAVTAVRTSPLDKQRRGPSSTCRWPLSGSCPCSGKEAVDVEEKYFSLPISPNHINLDRAVSLTNMEPGAGEAARGAAAAAGGGRAASPVEYELDLELEEMVKFKYLGRETVQLATPRGDGGGSSFPALSQTGVPIMKAPNRVNPPDDSPRASLEVFQPAEEAAAMMERSVELCHRRRAMRPLMFPADGAPRRSFTFPASPRARLSSVMEDDLTSDSSSDLFELEGFSTRGMTMSRPTYQYWRVSLNEVTMVEGFAAEKVADFSTAASDGKDGGEFVALGGHHHEVSKDGAGGGERRCEGVLSRRLEGRGSVSPRPAAEFGKEEQQHHGRHEHRHLPMGPLDANVRPTAPEGKANSASTVLPRVCVAFPGTVAGARAGT